MHRTYVRRRLVALAVALVAVLGLSGRIASALGAQPVQLAASRTYVVLPGDTLWTIAGEIAPRRDPRVVVYELTTLNPRAEERLVPGDVLALP